MGWKGSFFMGIIQFTEYSSRLGLETEACFLLTPLFPAAFFL
jgi:hypothetical protein